MVGRFLREFCGFGSRGLGLEGFFAFWIYGFWERC